MTMDPYREQVEAGDERRTRYDAGTKPSAAGLMGTRSYYAYVLFMVEGVRVVTIVERADERTVTMQVEGGEQWAVSRALANAAKLAGVIIDLEWTK